MSRNIVQDARQPARKNSLGAIDSLSALRLLTTLNIEHKSRDELIHEILEIMLNHQELTDFILYLVRDSKLEYRGSKNWHAPIHPQATKPMGCGDSAPGAIEDSVREVIETGSVRRLPAIGPDVPSQFAHTCLCLPIPAGTQTVGTLCVYDGGLDGSRPWDETSLHVLCSVLGNVLRNHQLIQDLKQAVGESVANNRELNAFIHSASHDLRAPLRSIHGFSQILLEDYGSSLDEVGRAHLWRCLDASKRMAMSMDGLLKLNHGRHKELTLSEIDLSSMAAEIISDLHRVEPAREVNWSIEKPIVVYADPPLLRLVLENLIGNAWKYTGHRKSARLHVRSNVTMDEHIVEISDNGVGFAEKESDKLFAPFHRLHSAEEFEGSGIGLATVRRIIERHGGRVWANAVVGKGAVFSFSLPLKRAVCRRRHAPEGSQQPPAGLILNHRKKPRF